MEDMSFINELPEAFKEKLKTTKYKSSEKMLKKLQDAVNMIESMRAQLKKEYIPVLAKKLYPMIKRSGPETKKYVDTLLEDINQTISKVQSKVNNGKLSREDGNKKISRLRGRLTKLRKIAEQAPQSEEEFAKFLMYTTHDMDWMGFMLMAPSTTSDPGLAGLVQYTSALAVEARRQAINVSNQLETAGNLLEEGMKEKGRKISNSPIKYYEDIIEDAELYLEVFNDHSKQLRMLLSLPKGSKDANELFDEIEEIYKLMAWEAREGWDRIKWYLNNNPFPVKGID